VHGLSTKFLSDKPLFASKAQELLEFIGDSPLVAHNASFDFGFLNMELGRCGHPPVDMGRMVDTIAMARSKHPGAKLSLDALCSRYGIDRSHRTKHGALLDAELLAQLYIELTGGRQIGLGLADDAGSERVVETMRVSLVRSDRPFRQPRMFQPLPEELERHRAFVDSLKDAIWTDQNRREKAHS
jgi:DNA polymerase-3 subunit epsilon